MREELTPSGQRAESSAIYWDQERNQIIAELHKAYDIKPRSSAERDILLIANRLYEQTRKQSAPFMTQLFDGQERYFQLLVNHSMAINSELFQQRRGMGSITTTLEQQLEDASIIMVAELANYYNRLERLKFEGLAETKPEAAKRWVNLATQEPEFLKILDVFDETVKEAAEAGATPTAWVNGLRVIQAKTHNRLNEINEDKETPAEAVIKKVAMELTDDLELTLPIINKKQWKDKVKAAQDNIVTFLGDKGISRKVPKIGDQFDPNWQMAIAGQGEQITRVGRGAFVDKNSDHLIQDAWVEVG